MEEEHKPALATAVVPDSRTRMGAFVSSVRQRVKTEPAGLQYASRIFIGSTLPWYFLQVLADTNPIWAISSMIAVTEGQLHVARANFRARISNTCIGGAVGLVFLILAGPRHWVLPLALAVTVLVSAYLIRVPTYWRIAPVTAALVVASSVQEHSRQGGLHVGLHRVGEVILGSAIAVIVAFTLAKIWTPGDSGSQAKQPTSAR